MKVYTKGGDKGKTSLVGGTRVEKSDVRLHAYGTTDELNSWIGLVADTCRMEDVTAFLRVQQSILFDLGSNLASEPGQDRIPIPEMSEDRVLVLEAEIDRMQEDLPELRSFILPGGDAVVSYCHLARTVCRRAERWTTDLNQREEVNVMIIKYLNRMSDYLFVLARYIGHHKGIEEVLWKPSK